MKNFKTAFTFLLLVTLFGSGKNGKNEETPILKNKEQKKEQQSVAKSSTQSKDITFQTSSHSIEAVKNLF